MNSWKQVPFLSLGLVLMTWPVRGAGDPSVVSLPGGARLHGVYNPDRDMYEWRGVRFVQPPLGALRWKPPQPITLTGDVDAGAFGQHCTQPGDPGSGEDCLFLNVSVPAVRPGPAPLPVMVDIHG